MAILMAIIMATMAMIKGHNGHSGHDHGNTNGHNGQILMAINCNTKGIIMAILAMIKGHTGNDQGPLNANTRRQLINAHTWQCYMATMANATWPYMATLNGNTKWPMVPILMAINGKLNKGIHNGHTGNDQGPLNGNTNRQY